MFPFGVSVFFPAFNDAPSLPELIGKTFRVLAANVVDYEVIVINDGSADCTGAVLEELVSLHGPRLRIVTHPVNRGYGAALRSGFAAATKEFVFYTDGDGQYDVGEMTKLFPLMRPGVSFVNGYKLERNDPWHRIVIGKAYNQFARFLFGVHLRDIDCDFRFIRRSLLADLESTSGTVCVELVRKLELCGMEVAEVGVHHYPRQHGRSQFFRIRSLMTTFYQLFRLWWWLLVMPRLGMKRADAHSNS
ncbi:glycosyltransferase family 2 protein [Bryobacter aggregatus]|uniref:glycosyltransferase family 2 protein n=1 Tax=Bryobacter aggregatus TaxID=360054 RepID=UPI0004E1AF9E|nr:glycosyltransferase family 2 protein [Bryobacter aggregatus]